MKQGVSLAGEAVKKGAIKALDKLTDEAVREMKKQGLTREIAEELGQFYKGVVERGKCVSSKISRRGSEPGNAAKARVELKREIAKSTVWDE